MVVFVEVTAMIIFSVSATLKTICGDDMLKREVNNHQICVQNSWPRS